MTLSIAYPGPRGSHTSAAAAALHPQERFLPLPGFRAVADAVMGGDAAYGVLPIESSLAGAVPETHDLIYRAPLSIVGEVVLPIRHCLATTGAARLDEIRVVRSHPSAFDQCRDLLAQLPRAQTVPAATTADAARQTAADGDPSVAAIVGHEAIALYGLTVLADDVGDGPAFTRFVSIASHMRITGDRTAVTFVTDHRPGALFAAIEPFAQRGVDLVQLVSRPIPETPWRYRFDAVVAGRPLDDDVRAALEALGERTRELRIVGVYDGAEASA